MLVTACLCDKDNPRNRILSMHLLYTITHTHTHTHTQTMSRLIIWLIRILSLLSHACTHTPPSPMHTHTHTHHTGGGWSLVSYARDATPCALGLGTPCGTWDPSVRNGTAQINGSVFWLAINGRGKRALFPPCSHFLLLYSRESFALIIQNNMTSIYDCFSHNSQLRTLLMPPIITSIY